MSNEEGHGIRIVRSLISGGIGMAGTLTALGAMGLAEDLYTGALACMISLFVGFIIRMGVEYGVTVTAK